jgi:hypothetical protein
VPVRAKLLDQEPLHTVFVLVFVDAHVEQTANGLSLVGTASDCWLPEPSATVVQAEELPLIPGGTIPTT